MIARIPSSTSWIFLILFFLITLISFYQAWENLLNNRFSRFSIDAIMLALINKFGSQQARKRAKISTKDGKRITLLGVYALLTGVGGIYAIIQWFGAYTWP